MDQSAGHRARNMSRNYFWRTVFFFLRVYKLACIHTESVGAVERETRSGRVMARVRDAATNETLGIASDALEKASREEQSGSGIVAAFCDDGRWTHVPEGQESATRACGHEVRVVYVD